MSTNSSNVNVSGRLGIKQKIVEMLFNILPFGNVIFKLLKFAKSEPKVHDSKPSETLQVTEAVKPIEQDTRTNIIKLKIDEFVQEAYKLGRAGGRIFSQPDEKLINKIFEGLNSASKAIAEVYSFPSFSPDKFVSDQKVLEEIENTNIGLIAVGGEIESAQNEKDEADRKAIAPPDSSRPESPQLIEGLAALAFGIPCLFGLTDIIRFDDLALRWLIGGLIALTCGFVITKLMFYVPSFGSSENRIAGLIGICLALGMTAGLCFIRLSAGGSGYLILGLTIWEFFWMFAIELVARRFRQSVADWDNVKAKSDQSQHLLKVATSRLNMFIERRLRLLDRKRSLEEYIAFRDKQPSIEALTEQISGEACMSYLKALEENKTDLNLKEHERLAKEREKHEKDAELNAQHRLEFRHLVG